METFTLIIWLMMGQRFEEMQLPALYPVQCTVFRDELLRERSPVRAECVAEPKRPPPIFEPPTRCADCGVVPRDKGPNRHS